MSQQWPAIKASISSIILPHLSGRQTIFFLINGKVYIKKPFTCVDTNPLKAFATLKLPCTQGEPTFVSLIAPLGEMLRGERLETCLKVVQEYKLANAIQGALFLDFPTHCFEVIGDNLCFVEQNQQDTTDIRRIPVDLVTAEYIFSANGLRVPSPQQLRTLVNSLKNGLEPTEVKRQGIQEGTTLGKSFLQSLPYSGRRAKSFF